ncbi:MAG: LuxR C-terminal-related transcriptional regulator [Polyangiaceae bacterium]
MGTRTRPAAPAPQPTTPPRGLDSFSLEVGGERLVVLTWDERETNTGATLTCAEADVLRLLLDGLANDEIARRRGTTPRTVAKQTEAVFRKLQVDSRRALYARAAELSVIAKRGG